MLLCEIIDQTLQVCRVMSKRIVVIESVNLYIVQPQVLINIYTYKLTQQQTLELDSKALNSPKHQST